MGREMMSVGDKRGRKEGEGRLDYVRGCEVEGIGKWETKVS